MDNIITCPSCDKDTAINEPNEDYDMQCSCGNVARRRNGNLKWDSQKTTKGEKRGKNKD